MRGGWLGWRILDLCSILEVFDVPAVLWTVCYVEEGEGQQNPREHDGAVAGPVHGAAPELPHPVLPELQKLLRSVHITVLELLHHLRVLVACMMASSTMVVASVLGSDFAPYYSDVMAQILQRGDEPRMLRFFREYNAEQTFGDIPI